MKDRGFYKGMLIGINTVLGGQTAIYMNSGRFNDEGQFLIKLYEVIEAQLKQDED